MAGRHPVRRGEIRWYTFAAPDKRRPVLLLTRESVIDTLNEIIVAPATCTIRGLATEVLRSSVDGIRDASHHDRLRHAAASSQARRLVGARASGRSTDDRRWGAAGAGLRGGRGGPGRGEGCGMMRPA